LFIAIESKTSVFVAFWSRPLHSGKNGKLMKQEMAENANLSRFHRFNVAERFSCTDDFFM